MQYDKQRVQSKKNETITQLLFHMSEEKWKLVL